MSDLSNKLVNGENLEMLAQRLDARFNEKLLLINDIDYETLLAFDTDEIAFDSDNTEASTTSVLGKARLNRLVLK
jgi:hypothetical protein